MVSSRMALLALGTADLYGNTGIFPLDWTTSTCSTDQPVFWVVSYKNNF
jgi:hypothetical protein